MLLSLTLERLPVPAAAAHEDGGGLLAACPWDRLPCSDWS